MSISLAFMVSGVLGTHAADIVVNVDRTTQVWSDLAMGAPSAEDDADRSQNPNAVFSYVPAYGKPHADAGASGFNPPRLNDGKFAASGDDPANSTWFDTKENSRVLMDLGRSTSIFRINVYSWHSGALSPQRYTLWASDAEAVPTADPADLSKSWKEVAKVDTFPLGEGGKHGSSIHSRSGVIGQYRYLLFDLSANKPEWSRSGFLSEIDVYAVGRELEDVMVVKREAGRQHLKFGGIHLSKPLKDETPFLIAGPRLYEDGAMDGTFPRVGRLDGDQGGVWCHPIKLVDKFEFEVSDGDQKPWRLVSPSRFEHQFASATFHFERNQLEITRQGFVPEEERMVGAFDETIPGGGDLVQLWSFGPFLECGIESLAGIRPQPGSHRVDLFPQLPHTLAWSKLEDCRIGMHLLILEHRKTGRSSITTVNHSKGDALLSGAFWLRDGAGAATIKLNGQAIKLQPQTMAHSGIELPCANYELRVGQHLTIERISP